jgi:Mrp family chromosome partitioning ATPase
VQLAVGTGQIRKGQLENPLSRNFELLTQAGRMHEIVQSEVEQPQPVAPPAEDTVPSTSLLTMSGAVRDEMSRLAQNLFLQPQGPRRVVFCGTESGSGCTWMCAHVADMLATQGRGSVCVVDCNLRSPGLHQQFGMENHHGLSDALLGSNSIRGYAHRLSRNLWMLSCGSAAEVGLTMLGSDRMRSRLTELRMAFDYVLIDAPPLNACNDAVILGGLSDGVVLTLKANSSRRETAKKAVQELAAANVRTLGAVLNQRTFPVPPALYKRL